MTCMDEANEVPVNKPLVGAADRNEKVYRQAAFMTEKLERVRDIRRLTSLEELSLQVFISICKGMKNGE
ncbi:hypothetical protein [Endozoicomonas lisbonensis]|uniref:Uncharacterized protein n=1 Tax=Endozoicomonas lisbonensis TaxID=3120522 RepID=A0ABV2SFG3_9GAMM